MDNDHITKPGQPSSPPEAPAASAPPVPSVAPAPAVPATPEPPVATPVVIATPAPPYPHAEDDDEAEQPVLNEAPEDLPTLPHPVPSHRSRLRVVLVAIIAIIIVGAVGVGGFQFGNNKGYTRGKQAATPAMAGQEALQLPSGATMVAQCTPGEGIQYIAPKDIPMGPIYNVYKDKVIGLEYMLPESDIANGKGLNLSAMSKAYDHVDVMYEAKGHAGLTEPHYHILLSTITYAQERQITCNGSSADVHNMGM